MKKQILRSCVVGTFALTMMLGISIHFTPSKGFSLKPDKEAMAFEGDLLYKNSWESCTAVALLQVGAGFMLVPVPGAENGCEFDWWESCDSQSCLPIINPY